MLRGMYSMFYMSKAEIYAQRNYGWSNYVAYFYQALYLLYNTVQDEIGNLKWCHVFEDFWQIYRMDRKLQES